MNYDDCVYIIPRPNGKPIKIWVDDGWKFEDKGNFIIEATKSIMFTE